MRPEKTFFELPVVISMSSKINGDLEFSSEVLIEGEACGKITSEKKITIGNKGFFKGTLYANDLVVFGRLDGNIIVTENLVLHGDCTIDGFIYTKYIELKEGASVNARVIMSDDPKDSYNYQIKKGRRDKQPALNPGNFFAKVFEELDTEMVTNQIYYSASIK